MSFLRSGHIAARFLAVLIVLLGVAPARADDQTSRSLPPSSGSGQRVGVQGFGAIGLTRQIASDSFGAVDMSPQSIEFGGGGQITNLWRTLFVQVGATRWRSTGERVFIDSRGSRFALGIPLTSEVTHIEVSGGWRFEPRSAPGLASRLVPYVGGGAGVVKYAEHSPFAQVGDDLRGHYPSYHGLVGLEIEIARWVGLATDLRYRVMRGILGESGVSAAVGENALDGVSATVRLVVGNRPRRLVNHRLRSAPARPEVRVPRVPAGVEARPEARAPMPAPSVAARSERRSEFATVEVAAPVFIAPDASRTPLRTLEPGTSIRVREEIGEWLRVEFRDPRWGTRVGYVLRKYCSW